MVDSLARGKSVCPKPKQFVLAGRGALGLIPVRPGVFSVPLWFPRVPLPKESLGNPGRILENDACESILAVLPVLLGHATPPFMYVALRT